MFERASEDEEGFSSGLIKGTRTAARSAARSRNCGIMGRKLRFMGRGIVLGGDIVSGLARYLRDVV